MLDPCTESSPPGPVFTMPEQMKALLEPIKHGDELGADLSDGEQGTVELYDRETICIPTCKRCEGWLDSSAGCVRTCTLKR
jgi:hypothetical protein